MEEFVGRTYVSQKGSFDSNAGLPRARFRRWGGQPFASRWREYASMAKVLLIEDDRETASEITAELVERGFDVDWAATGVEGLDKARAGEADARIVDRLLPGVDGLTIIEVARQERVRTPVLVLSALAAVDDRVRGLRAGGDDYLTKPFAFSELLARVQALIRRATQVAEPTSLSVGDLSMDLLSREVTRGGQKIELQSREFALLELLMRNPGRPMTKTMILEHVWDYSFDPQTNVVDVLAHRLRAKLEKDFAEKLIHTIRGVGYVLKAP
jgi:two-component system, OmpR family, response regulator